MNNTFTAEEVAILKTKGWSVMVDDIEAVAFGWRKLTKYNRHYICFEWIPSQYEDEEGRWGEWVDHTYAKIDHVEDFSNR